MTIVKIEQMKEEEEKESSGRCDKRGRPGGRSVLSATGKPPALSQDLVAIFLEIFVVVLRFSFFWEKDIYLLYRVKSHLMLGDKIVTFKSLRLKPEHITKRNFYQFCKKLKKEKKKSKQEIKGAIKHKRDQVGITTRKCGRGHLSGLR